MQHISEETVRTLVGRYADMVFRIACQNTHDRYEAEDIVQEGPFSRSFCALFPRMRSA